MNINKKKEVLIMGDIITDLEKIIEEAINIITPIEIYDNGTKKIKWVYQENGDVKIVSPITNSFDGVDDFNYLLDVKMLDIKAIGYIKKDWWKISWWKKLFEESRFSIDITKKVPEIEIILMGNTNTQLTRELVDKIIELSKNEGIELKVLS
jgi:hypothetical protein